MRRAADEPGGQCRQGERTNGTMISKKPIGAPPGFLYLSFRGFEWVRMATDEELMQAVGRGDLLAFEQVVLRHQKGAWSIARRFLGDATEAEDVAQEAFLRILEASPRYRPTASFRTYLYRVVTNLCLDRVEKKRPQYLETLPETASSDPSPADVFAARERHEAVRAALETIPPRQRAVIVLRHFEGLSIQEIACITKTTPKAVERLLARARSALEHQLKNFLKG
jgi:RNA polymerase sigma-70 factor (ECF subfamily)